MEQIKFKPFDRVIVKRKEKCNLWICAEFSHYNGNFIVLVGGYEYNASMFDILPFAGNEYLVGTSDMPEEEVKLVEGEIIVVFDSIENLLNVDFCSVRKFLYTCDNAFTTNANILFTNSNTWKYAIRFSDFNHNDIEETRKHILCVKDGKIVKAVV